MSEKLKDMRVILSVLLALTIGGSGLGFALMLNKNKQVVLQKDNEIVALQGEIDRIGQLTTVYSVRADVNSGKKIEESDLVGVELPVSIATNMISDPTEVVGSTYRVSLTGGTILCRDMVSTMEITDDMRYFDIATHYNPIGILPDSYVDVRISMPMGEDYIAMSHKKVEQVNSGVLKLIVTEEDIMAYNSMLIDSLIYPGTQIYAVEYVEGGVQAEAKTFYPMSKQAIAIAQKNPNLLSAIKEDIIARRSILETSGESVQIVGDDLKRTLEKGRESIVATYNESQREVEKQRAEKAIEDAKLAEQQAQ